MLVAVEKDKAKEYLDRYFSLLGATGYVKHNMVLRYLSWLFLVDFVEKVYGLLYERDYTAINDALICITNGDCCLLPYIYQPQNITWGEPIYMGEFKARETEDELFRIQENLYHRMY